jgi:hypothetical protein
VFETGGGGSSWAGSGYSALGLQRVRFCWPAGRRPERAGRSRSPGTLMRMRSFGAAGRWLEGELRGNCAAGAGFAGLAIRGGGQSEDWRSSGGRRPRGDWRSSGGRMALGDWRSRGLEQFVFNLTLEALPRMGRRAKGTTLARSGSLKRRHAVRGGWVAGRTPAWVGDPWVQRWREAVCFSRGRRSAISRWPPASGPCR